MLQQRRFSNCTVSNQNVPKLIIEHVFHHVRGSLAHWNDCLLPCAVANKEKNRKEIERKYKIRHQRNAIGTKDGDERPLLNVSYMYFQMKLKHSILSLTVDYCGVTIKDEFYWVIVFSSSFLTSSQITILRNGTFPWLKKQIFV